MGRKKESKNESKVGNKGMIELVLGLILLIFIIIFDHIIMNDSFTCDHCKHLCKAHIDEPNDICMSCVKGSMFEYNYDEDNDNEE